MGLLVVPHRRRAATTLHPVAEPLSFAARLGFAFACFFKVLFDGGFAARARSVVDGMPELPPPKTPSEPPAPEPPPRPEPVKVERAPAEGALQLLALFQREGRLVDFLEQDVSSFDDSEIGAAARVVHDGCQKALHAHAAIEPVRSEDEGATVTVEEGFDASSIKLTGNVGGSAPHKGVLRHRGWRAASLELPKIVGDHDLSVLAPAEVEL